MEDIKNVLKLLRLEIDEAWEDGPVRDLINSIKRTKKITVFGIALALVMMAVYMVVASFEYNSGTTTGYSPGYRFVHTSAVIVMVVITLVFALGTARVGFLSGVAAVAEAVLLPVLNGLYTLISVAMPDIIGNRFDKEGKIGEALTAAQRDGNVKEAAEKIIRGYMHGIAWAIFIPWLILVLPLAVFASLTAVTLSIVGIVILIYQVFGWDTEAYWYGLVQQAAMFTVVFFILWSLAILPFLNYTGVFEGWGPPGYIRTAFWFIVAVVVLALVGIGLVPFRHRRTGKVSMGVVNAPALFAAVVIFVAALLFGNLLLTKVHAMAPEAFPGLSGWTNPHNLPGNSGSSNSAGTTSNATRSSNGPRSTRTQRTVRNTTAPATTAAAVTSSTTATRPAAKTKTYTFNVSAKKFLDTGLDLSGHVIRIRVTGGQWRNHPTSGYNAGEGRGPYAEQSSLLVPSGQLSALVGLVDGGSGRESSGFVAGNFYEGNPGSGRLLLGLNDKEGHYDDNEGSLSIEIEIIK